MTNKISMKSSSNLSVSSCKQPNSLNPTVYKLYSSRNKIKININDNINNSISIQFFSSMLSQPYIKSYFDNSKDLELFGNPDNQFIIQNNEKRNDLIKDRFVINDIIYTCYRHIKTFVNQTTPLDF